MDGTLRLDDRRGKEVRRVEQPGPVDWNAESRVRTIYVEPVEPANRFAFAECHLGKAGEVLPDSLRW